MVPVLRQADLLWISKRSSRHRSGIHNNNFLLLCHKEPVTVNTFIDSNIVMSLPDGWIKKESKSHPGKFYYFNASTQETTWNLPTSPAGRPSNEQVQVLHILKKHSGSRRPASWRCDNITQSKETSISQIQEFRNALIQVFEKEGFEAMHKKFEEIALRESDCGSHERGGDLGLFGRGQMQKPFEEASFGLNVGGLSDIVDTDSGIHIILRIM